MITLTLFLSLIDYDASSLLSAILPKTIMIKLLTGKVSYGLFRQNDFDVFVLRSPLRDIKQCNFFDDQFFAGYIYLFWINRELFCVIKLSPI